MILTVIELLIRECHFCGARVCSFFVLCCSWHADTCGSWLCISWACAVWFNKRDYVTSLFPLASWRCWPAVTRNTKEKSIGNTRGQVKFDAGCPGWAWLRMNRESCVVHRSGSGKVIYWAKQLTVLKSRDSVCMTAETGTARLFCPLASAPSTEGKEISPALMLLCVVMIGMEWFEERLGKSCSVFIL